jgi:hypothetical protein
LGKFRDFIPCCLKNWALWRIPEKCFSGLYTFENFQNFENLKDPNVQKDLGAFFPGCSKNFRQFWIFRMPINKG